MCLKLKKNLEKTVVFAHPELLRTDSAHARENMKKNIDKYAVGASKTVPERPWPFQNRARSAPRRMKTTQERQKTQQERKMRLGSAPTRKVVPT